MLVNAPVGATLSHASWYARLWFQEPLTLKAFQSLLGVRRFFGPEDETLECLLEKSLEHQEEVTDTLGEQVRRAVEVLVQCLDKADQDRNRELLRDVSPAELYEAGLTVMMRLVFILCAEERGLLLLGDTVYDGCYAVSTLRGLLEEDADRHGPEVLERRHDAWARLLATFRAVFGGIEHEALRLPAMGGSLFDPDRFPFLEGRLKGTTWRDTPAAPLPIDNRTVLLLLEALQILEQPGGALLLSYRALDVEQIGHVYEGLLEHTVARVPSVTLGLVGSKKAKNPNVPLAELESAMLDGEDTLVPLVQEVTQRSLSAIRNALKADVDDALYGRLLLVCGGDEALANRIQPFANLLRTDAWQEPIVYRADSFMVTLGTDRRESGTHYTPKSLTETIVATTLEPVAYLGPAEGLPREKWRLKSTAELMDLRVCDPALGSGAFLVQSCRWLSERLVEAWAKEEAQGKNVTIDGEIRETLGNADLMPSDTDERLVFARRLVAERCLYGVDINPLAVELAKLSIWLVTLAKGRPFGFLDHNLQSGDSLLGITGVEQLNTLNMFPDQGNNVPPLFAQLIETPIAEAMEARKRLRLVGALEMSDVIRKADINKEVREILTKLDLVADALVGETLRSIDNAATLKAALKRLSVSAIQLLQIDKSSDDTVEISERKLQGGTQSEGKGPWKPFHWPLAFPEVFIRTNSGFDAFVGNPPFMFGKTVTANMGTQYNSYLVANNPSATKNVDICAHFYVRAFTLLRTDGTQGLLATSSIAEGATRIAALDRIISLGGGIYSAASKSRWPGKANVFVCMVHIFKGRWKGVRALDGRSVPEISSLLTFDLEWEPQKLAANHNLAFCGAIPNGDGFFLEPDEAEALLAKAEHYREVVWPFLIGRDLNSSPTQTASRYAINFWDWDETTAMRYADPYALICARVKPYRNTLSAKKPKLARNWWLYEANPKALYQAIGTGHHTDRPKTSHSLERVMVIARVSSTNAFAFVSNHNVFDCQLAIVASDDWGMFAVLQSSIHFVYAWHYGGKMKTDLRYSPTICFATFPFPDSHMLPGLGKIGQAFHDERHEILATRSWGLTRLTRMFHDPECTSQDIVMLRSSLQCLDESVAKAYGWTDIDLEHSFHKVGYLPKGKNTRFTVSERARSELLARLTALNKTLYEDELHRGLHKVGAKRGGATQ